MLHAVSRCREGERRRCRPCLRRRRRPLRRGRQRGQRDLRRQGGRDAGARHFRAAPNAKFVVDVKSTGLFSTDPVLRANGAPPPIGRPATPTSSATAMRPARWSGFEKSGHFFFNPPLGRGYDDGLVAAIAVCDMLSHNPGKDHGRSRSRPAQDLAVADHVAPLRRREEIWRGRSRDRAFQRRGRARRDACRAEASAM